MAISPTTDIGATGLETRFGRPSDDFIQEWYGDQKVKRVTEMLKNSAVIGALRLAIEMPIRNIDWQFTSEEGPDDPRLELLEAARANLSHSWNDHVVAALLFPFYGWSQFTLVYERIGSRLLWRKFKELGQETVYQWLYDDGGGLAGLKQKPYLKDAAEIPIERMLIYRFRYNRNSPEGESILRPAWVSYYYVKNLQQIEAIGIERNLNGLPVITPPQGADMTESSSESTDYGRAHSVARNIRNDEQAGVVVPPPKGEGDHQKWHVDLLFSGGASKVIDTDTVINRYEKRMLMAALAQFLILGQDNVGSLALSSDQTSFFGSAVNSCAGIIAETFTKFAIPRLCRLNGIDATGLQLEHSKAGDMDLLTIADALSKLTKHLTWTPTDEIWLRSLFGLPDKTVEEIEAEIEAKAARNPFSGLAPGALPPGEDDEDELSADYFASEDNRPPDDRQRRRTESRFQRVIQGFFDKQVKRVTRAAARLRP